MWSFLSTLFTLWSIYVVWKWLFPSKEERERRRIAKIQRKLGVYITGVWVDAENIKHPYLNPDRLVKLIKSNDGILAIYKPAAKNAEVSVRYRYGYSREGIYQAGAELPIQLYVEGIGYTVMRAPAECLYEAGRQDGALKKGDVVAMFHTSQEVIKAWKEEKSREEEKEREAAERARIQAAERWERYKKEDEERRKRQHEQYLAYLEEEEARKKSPEYKAQLRAEHEERMRKEKAEIAEKLKEKQRRRELEKQVRLELIDSGELFGDQSKRPSIPRDVVDAVYRRDGARCVYCGSTENLQLDHIIPFSKGGATSLENLQLLCQKCNLEKSNKIG